LLIQLPRTGGRALTGLAVCTLALQLTGCGSPQAGDRPHAVTICGTSVPTGGLQAVVRHLQADPTPVAAPTTSRLPAQSSAPAASGAVTYVRTSDSCSTGAEVVVEPAVNAVLDLVFPAADGKPAGIALVVEHPVVVRAWVAGQDQGSISLGS
jgi:hypothetical protein